MYVIIRKFVTMASSSWVGLRALANLISLACLVDGDVYDGPSGLSNYTFPSDFMFGVSTSAFQIEGGWNEGGKGESMWDTHLHNNPNFTLDKSNGDIAADSYHKWREDIEMIKYLNVDYYRMSISWPRLLPNGTDNNINKDGVNYYRRLFEELKKVNIEPVVTLFHWDLPTPLMDLGGWTNPAMVEYFEDYTRVAFTLFGDIVKIWTTINEPNQHCYNGYGSYIFVPALQSSGLGDYLCTHYILLAHARAYHLYDREFRPTQKGKVGITLDALWAEPNNSSRPEDHAAAEQYLQMHLGIFAHPIYSERGDYPPLARTKIDENSFFQNFSRSRLPYFSPDEIRLIKGSSDFFGLNHYTTFLMSPSTKEDGYKVPSWDDDTGVKREQNINWSIPGPFWLAMYPPGFRKLLNWIKQNYGSSIPIIITENGSADFGGVSDYDRVSYYNDYLNQLLQALYQDGVNVQGYFAWALMDNFEWQDGYATKFGLYHVDFTDPNRTRTPKLSAHNYREICRTRRINFDFIKPPTVVVARNNKV